MSRDRWIVAGGCLALGITLLGAGPAQAECPEGQSEVTIVTPSGRTMVRCLPDQALPGIQKAAERSGNVVIPAGCPCFTPSEVEEALAAYSTATCLLEEGDSLGAEGPCTYIECEDEIEELGLFALETAPGAYACELYGRVSTFANGCYFFDASTGTYVYLTDLTEPEGDACVAILEPLGE